MESIDLTNFWETQSGNSNETLLADPQLLWRAACAYFEACSKTPAIGYGNDDRMLKRVQPFTLYGLSLYIDSSVPEFEQLKADLEDVDKEKRTATQKELLRVMTRIETCIAQHKFIYAAAGLLNTRFITLDMSMHLPKPKPRRIIKVKLQGSE